MQRMILCRKAAEKLGLHAIDAPVTGGDSGAKAGTLTILAGGKIRKKEAEKKDKAAEVKKA